MTKVKINDKWFELTDDAALVLDDYMQMLELSNQTGKLSDNDFNATCQYVETKLMHLLETQNEIHKSDVEEILKNSSVKSKIISSKKRGFFGTIFYVIGQFILACAKVFVLMIKLIFKLFILCFNFMFLFICLIGIIGLIFLIPFMYLDLTRYGQHVMTIIPNILKWSLIATQIGLIIIALLFLGLIIKKKLVPRFLGIGGLILIVLAASGMVYSIADLRLKYGFQDKKIQKYSYNYTGDNLIFSGLESKQTNINLIINHFDSNSDMNNIFVETYSGKNIELELITKVNAADKESAQAYFDAVGPEDIILSGDNLILRKSDKLSKLPFSLYRRTIKIKKPEGLEIVFPFKSYVKKPYNYSKHNINNLREQNDEFNSGDLQEIATGDTTINLTGNEETFSGTYQD